MDDNERTSRIRDGDHVIVDVNKERQTCVKIKSNGYLMLLT